MTKNMGNQFDAIVVGAGHNGLVCSALLAKAGKRVLVLEANDQVGGAAVTREFAEGTRCQPVRTSVSTATGGSQRTKTCHTTGL